MRRYLKGGDAEVGAGRSVRATMTGLAAIYVLGTSAAAKDGALPIGFFLAALAFIALVTALNVAIAASHLRGRPSLSAGGGAGGGDCVWCGLAILIVGGIAAGALGALVGGWFIDMARQWSPATSRQTIAPVTVAALAAAYVLCALAAPPVRRLLRLA